MSLFLIIAVSLQVQHILESRLYVYQLGEKCLITIVLGETRVL